MAVVAERRNVTTIAEGLRIGSSIEHSSLIRP